MARPSLRDRFLTPGVAHAIVSPVTLLALLGGGALGFAAAGVAGSVALAVLSAGVRIGLAIPRAPRQERIDPFTLSEPWRHYVRDALQAHRRFADAVRSTREGPTRDRLQEIDARVHGGVREVWRIAQRGDDLVDARRRADPDAIRRSIAAGPSEHVLASLEAQLATVERLDRVIADADARLRLLNARLDEAAVRTIELSVRGLDRPDLLGLGAAVDEVVDEMEALRLAIEETGGRPELGPA